MQPLLRHFLFYSRLCFVVLLLGCRWLYSRRDDDEQQLGDSLSLVFRIGFQLLRSPTTYVYVIQKHIQSLYRPEQQVNVKSQADKSTRRDVYHLYYSTPSPVCVFFQVHTHYVSQPTLLYNCTLFQKIESSLKILLAHMCWLVLCYVYY